MTPPALLPLAAAVAVAGAGPVAVPPPTTTYLHASRHSAAIVPSKAQPAKPGASATRGSGAGTAGLVPGNAAVAINGAGHPIRDSGRATGRPRAGSARIRAPPR